MKSIDKKIRTKLLDKMVMSSPSKINNLRQKACHKQNIIFKRQKSDLASTRFKSYINCETCVTSLLGNIRILT